MIDKGLLIKCDRCGNEKFVSYEDIDDEEVPVNFFGDIGGGWTAVKIPHLAVLCPECAEEFVKNIEGFMDWCP